MFDARRAGANRRRRAPVLLTIMAVAVAAGCDDGPTDLTALNGTTAVQEVWTMLPSTSELEGEALEEMDSREASGLAAELILNAGDLAVEAEAAAELGADTDAGLLEEGADTLATRGLLSVFTSAEAEAVVSDVEIALARVQAGVAAGASVEVRARIAEAEHAMAAARSARTFADHAGALRHAARAAEALRWLDPEAKARAAVAAAWVLLDRAERLAGDDPEQPILRALQAARGFCVAGRAAIEAERWRLAVTEARACARIARAVIVRLAGGVDPDLLAERAAEAVAHAGALLERVTGEAGDAPEARVAELLAQAEALHAQAEVALEEQRYRVAIGLAAASSARSLWALRLIRDDLPDPYELRATTAVEVALVLSTRFDAAMSGGGTTPEIVEAVARADGLLVEAEAALEAGAWWSAWSLARTAIAVYVRVLLVLT